MFISQDPIGLAGGINPYQYSPNIFGWIDPLGLSRHLSPDEISALDNRLAELGQSDVVKGVYNFQNTDNLNYSGSAGTGKGTNTIRDRLMQHMRNDNLSKDDLGSLSVTNMNNSSDQDVWDKEAKTIRENGGIGDDGVANRRRPPNTGCVAKKGGK
jgi:uncharacterized protein RhaS with RHS repeats